MSQSKNINGHQTKITHDEAFGNLDQSNSRIAKKKLTIGMISDFFYPRLGGVEVSIYQLSCSLIRRGLKVIVITRAYKNRQIIRYMGNGVKVYYLPVPVLNEEIMFPTLYGLLPKLREIVIKEGIDIIHMHQSTSSMGLEGIMHSKTLGLNSVYTDHSLFAFDDLACVNINKVMKSFMTDIDQTICVSYIGRENLILRTMIDPRITNVIPNSVDVTKFKPELTVGDVNYDHQKSKEDLKKFIENRLKKSTDAEAEEIDISYILEKDKYINIIFLSRLTFRKGVDLLIEIIPEICNSFAQVRFIIGGDGPKRPLLENMIKSAHLHNKVLLLGSLQHNEVRKVMVMGHIYLNTSLTEAFCIANVEAASCGLYVISADIGGVAEVLPDEMITLVKPDKISIIKGITEAIAKIDFIKSEINGKNRNYEILKNTYNADIVARKAIKVYEKAMLKTDRSIINRFKKCLTIGNISGLFYLSLIILDYLFLMLLIVICPRGKFKKEKDFDYELFKRKIRIKKEVRIK